MSAIVELKNIKKHFFMRKGMLRLNRQVVRAVDNVDLTINKGENLSLVGESGSGKTTLGRVLLKLYPLTSGEIVFDGKNIARFGGWRMRSIRQQMQMVFQDPYSSLDPRYTIRNIIREAMSLDKQRFSKAKVNARIDEVITKVGLNPEVLDRFPHEFSGGERQRIAIARALVMNPKLLILDEAVSSLDVLIQDQIIKLLKELQEQYDVTYLFISHNLKVVRKISHKIAVMCKGKIVEIAPTEELFDNPLHPYTQNLLSAAVDYQVAEQQEYDIKEDSRLVEKSANHFVLE